MLVDLADAGAGLGFMGFFSLDQKNHAALAGFFWTVDGADEGQAAA